jgi:glycosyltransferase involved in cell wall biosynthesis
VTRRLLQAMAGARHGGAEIFFVRLALALQRVGETQQVLARPDPDRSPALRGAGIPLVELRFGGPFDVATRTAFRREIAAWRPDIVLTWMSRATAMCPTGDFVHVGRLGGYYDLKFYRRCQHLIGNTRAIVDYAVSQGWPRERAHYLPNFVPDPRATAAAPGPAVGRTYGAPLALALGRLHPNKGFDLLLDALAMTDELHLWIAGEGPLRDDLARQAERLGLGGRVRFLGWRDDVSALMRTADFLVCPSRHEPLGNVVIEGWAAGLPVVATASDGPAALIEEGRDGLLVPLTGGPDGGAEALAEAMRRIAGDAGLRARLAQGGRAAYEASFTEAAVVGRYRAFFDEVAG